MGRFRQSSNEQVRDHVGSTAAQRDLADLPRRWGWPPENIYTINSDLGMSATSASWRTGFQELVELVNKGKVGLVVVRDISRLARRQLDAVRFLDAASRTGTLVRANGKLYNPSLDQDQDLFMLMLEGLLAWRDNVQRSQMMARARAAKARGGAAVIPPPIGYVPTTHGKWIKDPDPQVHVGVERVWELYERLGSLGKVVKYLRAQELLFPPAAREHPDVEADRCHTPPQHPHEPGVHGGLRLRSLRLGARARRWHPECPDAAPI